MALEKQGRIGQEERKNQSGQAGALEGDEKVVLSMHDIAITIVNYKMKDHIERCLPTLFDDFKDSKLDIKVVIADNASEDGLGRFLQVSYPEVDFLPLRENCGFGTAHNQVLKSVEAKYYFILNPDTTFAPGGRVVERLHGFMEKNWRIGMAGPKLLNADGRLQYSCWRLPSFFQPAYSRTRMGGLWRWKVANEYYLMKDFNHEKTQPVDALMGSAMFVRNEAVKKVGRFDEKFWMYYEDVDWSRRMWKAGWPVYYVHDIVIKHTHGRGSAKVPGVFMSLIKNKLTRAHIKSWLWYCWKWH